jgi:hypothetical protein
LLVGGELPGVPARCAQVGAAATPSHAAAGTLATPAR